MGIAITSGTPYLVGAMRHQFRRLEELLETILERDVDARWQTGLVEQTRLRGVRKLNAVCLDPHMGGGIHDVDALLDGLDSREVSMDLV